jgi:hypothetical protein
MEVNNMVPIPVIHSKLNSLIYMLLDNKVMLDLQGDMMRGNIIISPFPSNSPDGVESKLCRTTAVFLNTICVREQFKESYLRFISSDEVHATILQKAYLSMLCASWCSYMTEYTESVSEKIEFFIDNTKQHISAYVYQTIMGVFNDAHVTNKLPGIFDIISDDIIYPLFGQGTFGFPCDSPFDVDMTVYRAMMCVWDYFAEQFMELEHSLEYVYSNMYEPYGNELAIPDSEFESVRLKESLAQCYPKVQKSDE